MVVRVLWKKQARSRPAPARPQQPPTALTRQEFEAGLAAILSPVAALLFSISLWRLGQDLGLARNFFIEDGPFSHWQPWFAISAMLALASSRLNRRSQSGGGNTPATG